MTEQLTWDKLPGWFNYEAFYDAMAERLPAGGTFVEVGVFAGRSLVYFAKRLGEKPARIFAVDRYEVTEATEPEPERSQLLNLAKAVGAADELQLIYKVIVANGLERTAAPIRADSAEGAKYFEDGSCDFVYLDASHTYEGHKKEIEAWLPKVKRGGVIGGHDFSHVFPGVPQAVMEIFPKVEVWRGMAWSYVVP